MTLSCPGLMYWIGGGGAVDFYLHVPQRGRVIRRGLRSAVLPARLVP